MIDVRSLQLAFGARDLFKDLSFQLGDRDRLCLAGRNGTGKTTLLKVMAGEIQPDGGQIIRSSDVRIGFLRKIWWGPRPTRRPCMPSRRF
jgi:ABC transport system ATP-binding/permease protein